MRRPRGPLWHNGDFLLLWSAQSVSQVGSQVTGLALPLAAIFVLHATTFEVAALNVVDLLPFVRRQPCAAGAVGRFSLPVGVGRPLRRRPTDDRRRLGPSGALASIPVAYAFQRLTLAQLFAVGFVAGTLTVFFDVSYQSYLPSLVERGELGDANSKLEVSRSGAQLAGPGLAGVLVGAITAPYAIAVDAASFAGSALFMSAIRRVEELPETLAASRRRMREEIAEGLRFVVGHPIMRPMLRVRRSEQLLLDLDLLDLPRLRGARPPSPRGDDRPDPLAREHRHSRRSADGDAHGAPLRRRPDDRRARGAQRRRARRSSRLRAGGYAIPFIVVAQLVYGFCAIGMNVNGISLVQAITPDRMLGRTNASRRFVVWGVMPFGGLIGGALGSALGLRATLWIGAIGCSLAFVALLPSPLRRIRVVEDAEALT